MGKGSKIEWCHHTWSPWLGCTKVGPPCDNCYAASWAKRAGRPELWQGERRRTSVAYWREPLKWDREAAAAGERLRIFPSLCDPFDNQVPSEWRLDFWDLIGRTAHLNWLLLTKRPQNIEKMLPPPEAWEDGWPNVWLGLTASNQKEFDRDWPHLKAIPAAVRFISYEPALGPLDIGTGHGLHWVICGGETGSRRRTMDPQWSRDLLGSCGRAGAAFFMKQMTGKQPIPDDLMVRQFPVS